MVAAKRKPAKKVAKRAAKKASPKKVQRTFFFEGESLVDALVAFVDRHGISAAYAAERSRFGEDPTRFVWDAELREAMIDPESLTPEVVSLANARYRRAVHNTLRWFDERNAAIDEQNARRFGISQSRRDEEASRLLATLSRTVVVETGSNPATTTTLVPAASSTNKRATLFGHAITGIVRWMGADAWTVPQAQAALGKLGFSLAEPTLKTQLRAGRMNERGGPAKLTKAQEEALYEALGDE